MRIIGGVKISKTMEEQIKGKMRMMEDAPYLYRIKGTPGGGCTAYGSAVSFLNKLEEWAKRYGVEIKLVKDNFIGNTPIRGHFIVEIIDPVGLALETIIEERDRLEREA